MQINPMQSLLFFSFWTSSIIANQWPGRCDENQVIFHLLICSNQVEHIQKGFISYPCMQKIHFSCPIKACIPKQQV